MRKWIPGWRMTEGGRTAGLLTALTALTVSTASAQTLQQRIDARLDSPPFNRQLWGVALVDDRGRLLYGRNQDRLFIPASNTKLLVTSVASALLPPTWTVKTSLYAGGPVVEGVIQGDLVLYGRGDPSFSDRCYATDTTRAGACDHDIFARFRALGLRPVQIWLPDTSSPAFRMEARRQMAAIAASAGEADDQAFVDAISEDVWSEP